MNNNVLAAFGNNAPKHVINAIQKASVNTGVDFSYMVQQAHAESSFNPSAKAKTSSATGLFQFIDSTWMNMVDKHGEKYGIDTNNKSRQQILNMRKDPQIASNMAAEFASDNQKFLESHWAKGEKHIGSTELYMAHFMGAGGAAAFLNARDENPLQTAAYIFPKEARANKNIFYDRDSGRAKTLEEIYAGFDQKFKIKNTANAAPSARVATYNTQPQVSSENLLAFGVENSGFNSVHAKTSANVPPKVKTHYVVADTPQMQEHITSRIFKQGFISEERDYAAPSARKPQPPHNLGGLYAHSQSPYASLISTPIDVMMLAQLGLPTDSKTTRS